jgi:hypothetical protein
MSHPEFAPVAREGQPSHGVGTADYPKVSMPGDGAHDSIVLGAPSVLSTWVFESLREVCALVPERVTTQDIDRNHPVEPPLEHRGASISLSLFPSAPLLKQCDEATTPILLLLDDPADSVRYLQHMSQGSVIEALRIQTAAAANYAQLRGHPKLLIVHRLVDFPSKDILDLILGHLGIALSPSEIDALSQKRLGPRGRDADLESSLEACVAGYEPLDGAQSLFSEKELAMIGGVLGPLVQMSYRDDAGPIVWPIDAFLSGDSPDRPAALVADLTGGARILYYGPYFNLPAGSWKVRMMVGFSAGAIRTPFSIEVYGGQLLAHATMVPEAKGVFHASFGFGHDNPSEPVEIRVRTDRGAIEGRLAFGSVEFSLERLAAR